MYRIEPTPEALEDLASIRKYDRTRIVEAIETQLPHQPGRVTRNRKRLGPNKLAEWELRVGKFRVFFDILDEEAMVKVVAVGYKEGSKLFVHGKEYEL